MDPVRSNLCQYDVTELFEMLESTDRQTVESVQGLMLENLSASKDTWLLGVLVDYYIASQSASALDILVRVREPHDKHIFDKILEFVKCEKVRYVSLLLLSHLVHRQPSWLYKIAQHRLFQAVLSLLKTDTESPCLLCALFSVISLLPVIPSKVGPYLGDLFEIFSRLASWAIRKPIGVPEIYVLHLQVGVYTLFHRLYGMYPCNFLGYLRSYYGGREYNEENFRVFTVAVKPMLERVRLHPLLVTACKETELSQKRWKRLAPHDIIAECANISLDSIEGTPENSSWKSSSLLQPLVISSENSGHFQSLSSTASFVVDSASACIDSSSVKMDSVWTPSDVCQFSTPPPLQSEETAHDLENAEQVAMSECGQPGSSEPVSTASQMDNVDLSTSVSEQPKQEMCIPEALEAREELVDREVSELTSIQPPSEASVDVVSRSDTPFCSTTQNLTDKPRISASGRDSAKDEDDSYEETEFVSQNQAELRIVRTMSRFRYFSQCGPSSEAVQEPVKRHVPQRSSSCPDIKFCCKSFSSEHNSCSLKDSAIASASKMTSEDIAISHAQSSPWRAPAHISPVVDTSYEHLLPLDLHAVHLPATSEKSSHLKSAEYVPFFCSLSPSELLDRHLQMGTESHISQLCSIPITSSKNANWTHFGGKAPEDEVAMLQSQILLLHNQLMFERHRREMHSERNRRLLGKAKRAQIQEEYIAALKDQVMLLEKENDDLKMQLKKQSQALRDLEQEMVNIDIGFNNSLRKLLQESSSLYYSNKQLQGLLVAQKQENDKIREENKKCQSKLLDRQLQLDLLKHKLTKVKALEKELSVVIKQNIMLQELNHQYEEKLELQTEKVPSLSDIERELSEDAALIEIAGLKETLEVKTSLYDAAVARNAELEDECANLQQRLSEQMVLCQTLNATHKDEIKVQEERLQELQNINQLHSSHILELYHKLDMLELQISSLTSRSTVKTCTQEPGKSEELQDNIPGPSNETESINFSTEVSSMSPNDAIGEMHDV